MESADAGSRNQITSTSIAAFLRGGSNSMMAIEMTPSIVTGWESGERSRLRATDAEHPIAISMRSERDGNNPLDQLVADAGPPRGESGFSNRAVDMGSSAENLS